MTPPPPSILRKPRLPASMPKVSTPNMSIRQMTSSESVEGRAGLDAFTLKVQFSPILPIEIIYSHFARKPDSLIANNPCPADQDRPPALQFRRAFTRGIFH